MISVIIDVNKICKNKTNVSKESEIGKKSNFCECERHILCQTKQFSASNVIY